MNLFWILIAVFYFILAVLSFYCSNKFSRNFKGQYKNLRVEVSGQPFLKHLIDYLNVSTWVNAGGFLLAAIAALISLL